MTKAEFIAQAAALANDSYDAMLERAEDHAGEAEPMVAHPEARSEKSLFEEFADQVRFHAEMLDD